MLQTFNLNNYRDILVSAKRVGYQFIDFTSINLASQKLAFDSSQCLLRHDVDADLAAALIMAQIENKLGIASTYFIMLRSPLYNLMGSQNHLLVEKILGLGHAIGLHYGQEFDIQRGYTAAETSLAIEQEAPWLDKQLPLAKVSR